MAAGPGGGRCRRALARGRLARAAASFASLRADGRGRVFLSGTWPLTLSDPVSCGRDSSPGAGSRRLQVNPAQGGLGQASAAAGSSRCRLRSARARINFTHIVELVPYSCASARRGGVDGGGVRRRPARIARNANEAVTKSCDTDPGARFGASRRMSDPEDLRDLWWRRLGVRIRQPAGSPTSPPASPRASGAK